MASTATRLKSPVNRETPLAAGGDRAPPPAAGSSAPAEGSRCLDDGSRSRPAGRSGPSTPTAPSRSLELGEVSARSVASRRSVTPGFAGRRRGPGADPRRRSIAAFPIGCRPARLAVGQRGAAPARSMPSRPRSQDAHREGSISSRSVQSPRARAVRHPHLCQTFRRTIRPIPSSCCDCAATPTAFSGPPPQNGAAIAGGRRSVPPSSPPAVSTGLRPVRPSVDARDLRCSATR